MADDKPSSSRLREAVMAITSDLLGSKFAVRYFFGIAALVYFMGHGGVADGPLTLPAVQALIAAYLATVVVLHVYARWGRGSRTLDRFFLLIEAPLLGVIVAQDPSPSMPLQLLLVLDIIDHGLRFGLRSFIVDGAGFVVAGIVAYALRATVVPIGIESAAVWTLFLGASIALYALRLTAERERADARAAEAGHSIGMAVEAAGLGIWSYDLASNRIIWDANTQRLGGIAAAGGFSGGFEEFIRLLKAEDAQRLREQTRVALHSHAPWQQEYELIWPDGSVHVICSRGMFLYDENGRATRMLGVSWDTTHLRRENRLLTEALTRLDVATAATGVGFWWAEAGNRKSWSDAQTQRLFGLVPREGGTRLEDFMALVHPDDQATISTQMQRALDECGDYRAEFRIRRPDGEERIIRAAGRAVQGAAPELPRRLVGASIDVTRERRDQQQLKLATERLHAAGAAARVGVFRYTVAEARVDTDPQFEALLGLEPGSFGGRRDDLFACIHPDDRATLAKALDAHEGERFGAECRSLWPDGSTHHLLLRGQLRRDAAGAVTELAGAAMGISRLVAAAAGKSRSALNG